MSFHVVMSFPLVVHEEIIAALSEACSPVGDVYERTPGAISYVVHNDNFFVVVEHHRYYRVIARHHPSGTSYLGSDCSFDLAIATARELWQLLTACDDVL